MDFHVGFDPGSLAEIVRLAGFSVLLDAEIQPAIIEGGQLLTEMAQAKTWEVFDNPTGQLASTIYPYVISPSQMAIAVGSPYGRRRELGFSGMTDALGRYFANDPAKPYLQPTVDTYGEAVAMLIAAGVQRAWARVGGP